MNMPVLLRFARDLAAQPRALAHSALRELSRVGLFVAIRSNVPCDGQRQVGTGSEPSLTNALRIRREIARMKESAGGLAVRAGYFLIERFSFSYVVAAQAPVHIRRTRRPGERRGPPEMHLSNDAKERTTILLVEDECLLRDMLEETLTEAGFAVLSAASGEERLPCSAGCRCRGRLSRTSISAAPGGTGGSSPV